MNENRRCVDLLLNQLSLLDPELAGGIAKPLREMQASLDPGMLGTMVADVAWGLATEQAFGREIADGYLRLFADPKSGAWQYATYRKMVRRFGADGPTVGRLMAAHLPSVLLVHDSSMLRQYVDTFNVMYRKGSYTLTGPLEGARTMLASGDLASSFAYFVLLRDAFSQEISYNRSIQLTYILPKAAASLAPSKRSFQISALSKVIRKDIALLEAFLEGLEKGLRLLPRAKLETFVASSLDRYEKDPLMGRRFLSLGSRLAAEMCANLQVSARLQPLQQRLVRYLRARTGLSVAVKPLSSLYSGGDSAAGRTDRIVSDGNSIYLPDEIERFADREQNSSLYWHLCRLESGLIEFGTFDFDYEKTLLRCRDFFSTDTGEPFDSPADGLIGLSDLNRFLQLFPHKTLARTLFTVYEHGRVRLLMADRYPGLLKRSLPVFQNEARSLYAREPCSVFLAVLYARIALDMTDQDLTGVAGCEDSIVERSAALFEKSFSMERDVENSALLVCRTYGDVLNRLVRAGEAAPETDQMSLRTPFGRVLDPDRVTDAYLPYAATARALREKLRNRGIPVFRSDLRRVLMQQRGVLSLQDIQDVLVKTVRGNDFFGEIRGGLSSHLEGLDWLENHSDVEMPVRQNESTGTVFRYPEWDWRFGDYLKDHVRIVDRTVPGCAGSFYADTLARHRGLIAGMRRAFEMLKPQGLSILRQWIEGDQFDYRALIEFAVDRKLNRVPSDRLYIKRVKQRRDVAVLVLVDLSRSTANKAADSGSTVLDIEKEAVVLLAEALKVVGDRFAVAGYSGTGRLGVDYLRVKDFTEAHEAEFQRRINALTSQRSTRMGAAIRHASAQLEKIPAKIKVLMTIGDGFPNDVGYKRSYAISDTRQAVHEARSKQIHFRAITVNIAGDPKLDDLYGPLNHNVISDVEELPDKLLGIYSAMTKM